MRSIVGCSLLVAALANTACRTMKAVSLEQLSALSPDRAWVTHADDAVVVVFVPQVSGDTLAGYVNGQLTQVPRADLKQVVVRKAAPMRTALLVGGVAVGVGGLLAALSGSGNTPLPTSIAGQPGDCDKHPDDPICQGHP